MKHGCNPLPWPVRFFGKIYYGWVVALASAFVMFATVGIGFYCMAIILDGLPQARGFHPRDVAAPTSAYFVLHGVFGPIVGKIVDRYGARGPITIGAIVLASSLFLLGHVKEVWHLWPIYVVMAFGFVMCSALSTNALIAKWFIVLRARALTVAQSGVSLGGMCLAPLAAVMFHSLGFEIMTACLSGIVLCIAVPVSWCALANDPLDHGLKTDGGIGDSGDSVYLKESYQRTPWTVREALMTPAFWILALAFSMAIFTQTAVLVSEVALVHEGTSIARVGAYALSITAVSSMIGRFFVGAFADRVQKKYLASGVIMFQCFSVVAFSYSESTLSFYFSAFAFGLTIGNVYMLQSLLIGEYFGLTSFGSVYGALISVTQVLGGVGPWALAYLYDAMGSYQTGLHWLAVIGMGGALAVLMARGPTRQRVSPTI